MMEEILFSIIMPVYNGEKYLQDALDSVKRQTYKNWELLCVDDGSVDNSLDILRRNECGDTRIHVICQQHSGSAGAARASALQYAKGAYCALLDCDDYWSDDVLEAYFLSAERTGADFIVPYAVRITDEKNILYDWKPYQGDYDAVISGETAFELSISWQIFGCGCVRTELFRKVGIEKKFMNGDELTTRKLFANADKVAFSEGTYFYRDNADSTTKKGLSVKSYDALETSFMLFCYAELEMNTGGGVNKAANRFLGQTQEFLYKYNDERKLYQTEDAKYARDKLNTALSRIYRNRIFINSGSRKKKFLFAASLGNLRIACFYAWVFKFLKISA